MDAMANRGTEHESMLEQTHASGRKRTISSPLDAPPDPQDTNGCVIVSHEMGSDGGRVAREACEITGYHFVQNHTIGKAVRDLGIRGQEWRWLGQSWSSLLAPLDERPDVHLTVLRPALLEICAEPPGTLLLGRGIRELLQGLIPFLAVHITASYDTRVGRIMQRANLPRVVAEDRVRRSDEENAWFYRCFFQVNWSDRSRYDLVLDTSMVTPEEAMRSLVTAMHRQATSQRSVAMPIGQRTKREGR